MNKNNEPQHGSLVQRSSIDRRFQWNINDIYPDQEAWEEASQQLKKLLLLSVNIKVSCMTARL